MFKMNLQNKNYLSLKKYFLVASSLILLGGCANQSSSSKGTLKKYSDLKKTLGPVHNNPEPTDQKYAPSDLYKLYVVNASGSADTNFVTLVAGQRNTITIHAELSLPGVSYRLISRDLPAESEPLKDLGNGNWEFSWNPSKDLARALKDQPPQIFHVSIEILEVTDIRSKTLAEQLRAELTLNYRIINSSEAPEIIEVRNLDPNATITKINEGETRELEIIIKDTTSSLSQPPVLDYTPFTDRITRESTDIDAGRRFMIWGPVEPLKDKVSGKILEGLWKATISFNTTLLEHVPVFPIPGVNTLPAAINSHLLLFSKSSATGIASPIIKISFQITYRRELLRPVIEGLNEELTITKQKETLKFSFKTYLPSSVGLITTFLSDEAVKLEGSPKLTCNKSSSGSGRTSQKQDCTFTWKIPCSMNPGDLSIKILAAGEYEGQRTSTEITKKISITEIKECKPKTPPTSPEGGK